MLLNLNGIEKSITNKTLFKDLSLHIEEGEKVALIGRNGLGKTTLFRIIAGLDKEYEGSMETKKGIKIVFTQQEHFLDSKTSALEYVLAEVPEYINLKEIIDTYPNHMGEDIEKINRYTESLNKFASLGYYSIEDEILSALESFKIDIDKALLPMEKLSGGEKRFVELVKVMFSKADLALIDEPTNHMDYVGKQVFIDWMNKTKMGVFVITHDRDVLASVSRIIELKNTKAVSFHGNYDAYLKQNSLSTVTVIKKYEEDLKVLEKLHKQILEARIKKWKGGKGAKTLEDRLQREYDSIKSQLKKPSIWIDEKSKENISSKVVDKYEMYKDKNISIHNKKKDEKNRKIELLKVSNLSIGYTHPLFENKNFIVSNEDRLMIRGRNGAGKSSLVKTILSTIHNEPLVAKKYTGAIEFSDKIRVGVYEQELDHKYINLTLKEALMEMHYERNIPINEQNISQILADYLFDPYMDRDTKIKNLSGGQKARFQIIKMLMNSPNLLILDEPTNHLDLPSIEELENALLKFDGAILYISHDTYFANKIGGEIVKIGD